VTTPAATSATSSADHFTYVTSGAAPTVMSVFPNRGSVAGGTHVYIFGTNFNGATTVLFGATAATGVTVLGPHLITATSPSGSGTVDVTVTTSGGTSATSSNDQFIYEVHGHHGHHERWDWTDGLGLDQAVQMYEQGQDAQ
jgi:hypothetical protein